MLYFGSEDRRELERGEGRAGDGAMLVAAQASRGAVPRGGAQAVAQVVDGGRS